MNSDSEPALPGCTRGAQRTHTDTHTRRADNLEGRGLAGLGGSVNRWKEPLRGRARLPWSLWAASEGARAGGGGSSAERREACE